MPQQRLNLVTGAAGFTGANLVKHLLEKGERVIATDLESAFSSKKRQAIFRALGVDFSHRRVTVIPADLTKPETLPPLFKRPVTHVFHTASLYDYSASMEALRHINIDGFVNFVEAAVAAKPLHFIQWSTCGVFGKPYPPSAGKLGNTPFSEKSASPKNSPIEQDEPAGTHLVNAYSVTKWKQEQLAWKYHRERGLPLTVVRPAPLYGPGSDYGHGGIIMTIHKGYLPITFSDAKNYVNASVHIDDMVRFADFISRRREAIGEDFNVADDGVISQLEFLQYIALLLGRRMRVLPLVNLQRARPIARLAARAWRRLELDFGVPRVRVFEVQSTEYIGSSYWISNKKTKDWGFVYRYPDVREGLRDTIQWFRQAGWLD